MLDSIYAFIHASPNRIQTVCVHEKELYTKGHFSCKTVTLNVFTVADFIISSSGSSILSRYYLPVVISRQFQTKLFLLILFTVIFISAQSTREAAAAVFIFSFAIFAFLAYFTYFQGSGHIDRLLGGSPYLPYYLSEGIFVSLSVGP